MAPPKPAITVESIQDGYQKVIREIGQLRAEVAALRALLNKFIGKRNIHKQPYDLGIDRLRGQSAKTREPKSEIREFLWDIRNEKDLEDSMKAIRAMIKDLDGALRDVRATRTDINAIADDSDLRAEFRNWRNK